MKTTVVKLLFTGAFMLMVHALTGQVQNFRVNQYMFYQSLINPAAQASYEDINGALFYRNQWAGVKGAPVITGMQFSLPLENQPLAVGLSAFKDQIGAHSFTRVSLPVSYYIQLNEASNLSFGVTYNYINVRSNYSELDIIDDTDPLALLNETTSLNNFQFGTYYFRNNFYAGLAVANLGNHTFSREAPNQGLIGANSPVFRFHFGGALHEVVRRFYNPRFHNTESRRYRLWFSIMMRYVEGLPLNADFNILYELKNDFGVGFSYGTSNELKWLARIPLSQNLKLGYSYDHSISKDISNLGSTHEIILIFERRNVRTKKLRCFIPRF